MKAVVLSLAMLAAQSSSDLKLIASHHWQEGGNWVIDYNFQYTGSDIFALKAGEILIKYKAEVSNSRLKDHSIVRFLEKEFPASKKAMVPVCPSCFEVITAKVEPELVAPDNHFHLIIQIEHSHPIYQFWYPLLGKRTLKIKIGEWFFHDTRNFDDIDDEIGLVPWYLSEIGKGHLCDEFFHSAPDCLILYDDGRLVLSYFRFEDNFVPPHSRWKLTPWYNIAIGTDGEAYVRVREYLDHQKNVKSPGPHKRDVLDDLLDGEWGRWHKFEKMFQTSADVTTHALDFRLISPTGVGILLIDDVSIVPIGHDDKPLRPRDP